MEFESTQSYVTFAEGAIISKGTNTRPMAYPQQFYPEIAELFGYIVCAGTLSEKTVEINFTDCLKRTEMVQRIKDIYQQFWEDRPIRLNVSGFPRICGRKHVTFVKIVLGGKDFFDPGKEKTPAFVLRSGNVGVKKAFLKSVFGAAPKKLLKDMWVFAFRSASFKVELKNLLQDLNIDFVESTFFISVPLKEIEKFKELLDLKHPSWWT